MNAGFYSTPCSLTWPPRIHPIYEHHSVNKPPTKQRSTLSLHNLYWLLSYLRSDFINSLGCPAHPTVGYNLGKGLQGNSTCNIEATQVKRVFYFFFCKCVNSWNETVRHRSSKTMIFLLCGGFPKSMWREGKREHLCLVSSNHIWVWPAARSRSGVRMKSGFSLVTVVSTPVISQWTMSVLLAILRPVWVCVYIKDFILGFFFFFRTSGWDYRCASGLGSHSTQQKDSQRQEDSVRSDMKLPGQMLDKWFKWI